MMFKRAIADQLFSFSFFVSLNVLVLISSCRSNLPLSSSELESRGRDIIGDVNVMKFNSDSSYVLMINNGNSTKSNSSCDAVVLETISAEVVFKETVAGNVEWFDTDHLLVSKQIGIVKSQEQQAIQKYLYNLKKGIYLEYNEVNQHKVKK